MQQPYAQLLPNIKRRLAMGAAFWALLAALPAAAQNTRISNYNHIGWYNYFGTIKLNKQWSVHTEYQWRRNNWGLTWQQSLLRTGINYQLRKEVQLRLGYAWIETYAYGEIPINSFGRQFTEHRTYQMATVQNQLGKLDLLHRFMLEQRWLGRYSQPDLKQEDAYLFANRLRYMLRLQEQVGAANSKGAFPYVAAYDELFIGFGKNVKENVFDQNRIGLLAGYKLNNAFRIEGGYLNQIVQLGREVNGHNVFQYNNGIIINTLFTF